MSRMEDPSFFPLLMALFGCLDSSVRADNTIGDGLVIGVSNGWDAGASEFGPFHKRFNSPSGRNEEHRGKYDFASLSERDCWSREDCDISPNVTRCGVVNTYRQSGQHEVACPPRTVGRCKFNERNLQLVCHGDIRAWLRCYFLWLYVAHCWCLTIA